MSDQTPSELFTSATADLENILRIGGVAHFDAGEGKGLESGEIANAGTKGFLLDDGSQVFFEEVHWIVGPEDNLATSA